LSALRKAGFTRVTVVTTADFGSTLKQIVQKPNNGDDAWPSMELDHYTSDQQAQETYNSWSHAGLRRLEAYWLRHPKGGQHFIRLPHQFEIRRELAFQVCNVVLVSYNRHDDPQLTARIRRSARLLHASCR